MGSGVWSLSPRDIAHHCERLSDDVVRRTDAEFCPCCLQMCPGEEAVLEFSADPQGHLTIGIVVEVLRNDVVHRGEADDIVGQMQQREILHVQIEVSHSN